MELAQVIANNGPSTLKLKKSKLKTLPNQQSQQKARLQYLHGGELIKHDVGAE
jgi:hypothetical protein